MSDNDREQDTDVLIALVNSILEPQIVDVTAIVEALVRCNGNAEDAAKLLKSQAKTPRQRETSSNSVSFKRKRPDSNDGNGSLDSWFGRSQPSSSRRGILGSTPSKVHTASDEDAPRRTAESLRIHVSSSSPSKPSVDLMSLLRGPSAGSHSPSKTAKQKSASKPVSSSVPRNPPLTLPSPALVAAHTPCTLHFSVLPPELACRLFHTMCEAARGWQRNRWWLFDRMVESPHRTSFFIRRDLDAECAADSQGEPRATESSQQRWSEAARFWYNGRVTDPPPTFPDPMEEACHIIERVVNEEMMKRPSWPSEWGPPRTGVEDKSTTTQYPADKPIWRANVAASNCYEGGKETVGWHSDQLTYLGPYPTIASLSLGTRRTFSLREVVPSNQVDKRRPRTFNIPLPHNSLMIMHASTQERFKHSIPPQGAVDLYKPLFPAPSPTSPTSRSTPSTHDDTATLLGEKQDDQFEHANRRHSSLLSVKPPSTCPPSPCGHMTINGPGCPSLRSTVPLSDTSTIMIEPSNIQGNLQLSCHSKLSSGERLRAPSMPSTCMPGLSKSLPNSVANPGKGCDLNGLDMSDIHNDGNAHNERSNVDGIGYLSIPSTSGQSCRDSPAAVSEREVHHKTHEVSSESPTTADTPKMTGSTKISCTGRTSTVAEGSNVRINITFRFYRPDFRPNTIPRCKCDVPMILRPDMKGTLHNRLDGHARATKDPEGTAAKSNSGVSGLRGSAAPSVTGQDMAESMNGMEPTSMKYWWTCFAHAQNDGKGCGYWRVMDMVAEGRGWREGL